MADSDYNNWYFANLCQILERIKRRGGIMYNSENEELSQIYCQLVNDNKGCLPDNFQEKFDEIFELMLENSENSRLGI